MASDLLTLNADMTVVPALGAPSGFPSLVFQLTEKLVLQNRVQERYVLVADAPQAVALTGLTGAHVVVLRALGGHVAVALTSADGSAQVVPLDDWMALISRAVPFTALTLTRDPGVETTVEVFLGQKA